MEFMLSGILWSATIGQSAQTQQLSLRTATKVIFCKQVLERVEQDFPSAVRETTLSQFDDGMKSSRESSVVFQKPKHSNIQNS